MAERGTFTMAELGRRMADQGNYPLTALALHRLAGGKPAKAGGSDLLRSTCDAEAVTSALLGRSRSDIVSGRAGDAYYVVWKAAVLQTALVTRQWELARAAIQASAPPGLTGSQKPCPDRVAPIGVDDPLQFPAAQRSELVDGPTREYSCA